MQCVIACGGPALPSFLGAVTFQPREQALCCCMEQLVVHWRLMTLNFGYLDAVSGSRGMWARAAWLCAELWHSLTAGVKFQEVFLMSQLSSCEKSY